MRKIVSLITTCLIFVLGVYFIYNYNKEDITINSVTLDNTLKKEKTSINTTGGICLLGIIDKDKDGWYINLDNIININLDNGSKKSFNNVNKIRIYDEKLVNIESFYKELVTLKGIIDNQDDILYLVPYLIIRGKNTIDNVGVSNLDKINNEREFDSNLLPLEMNSINKDKLYKYNYYMLDNESLEYLGNDFILFYKDFVKAFLNYKTSVKVSKKEYADILISILDYEFPVFFSDGEYDFLNYYNEEDKTFNWKYKTKNKEEHNALLKEFENNANMFLNGVSNEEDDSIKAQNIYHNLSKAITYNTEGLKRFKNLESYYVYKNKSGVSNSIANTYCQLLTQVDISCTLVVGIKDNNPYTWSLIKIDNDYYFADISREINYSNGNDYKYFGISINEFNDTKDIIIGRYNYKSITELEYDFLKKLDINS